MTFYRFYSKKINPGTALGRRCRRPTPARAGITYPLLPVDDVIGGLASVGAPLLPCRHLVLERRDSRDQIVGFEHAHRQDLLEIGPVVKGVDLGPERLDLV